MKIGVGLFGMHYHQNYMHWMNWNCYINWKNSLENYKEKLFVPENTYYFYSSTYHSDQLGELKKDFAFNKLKLNTYKHQKSTLVVRNKRMLETLELMIDGDCEYYMITRYDLYFNMKPLEQNINYKKINVLCNAKWGSDDSIVDDNWYFLPAFLLEKFINNIKQNINLHSHRWNKIMDINAIDNTPYYSHEIPYYKILRKVT